MLIQFVKYNNGVVDPFGLMVSELTHESKDVEFDSWWMDKKDY